MNQIIKDRRVKFSAYDSQIVPELIQMIDSVLPRGQRGTQIRRIVTDPPTIHMSPTQSDSQEL